jgi:uncharacterized protein involved in outer membrane biogenesis
MKKKTWIGLAILLVILVTAFLYLRPSALDREVKSLITDYASDVLQAKVTLDRVNIYPKIGEGVLTDVRIGNPVGYNPTMNAIEFEAIRITFNPMSLAGNGPIKISKIEFHNPRLNYEIKASGVPNIEVLHSRIKGHLSAAKTTTDTKNNERKDAQMVVKELRITQTYLNIMHEKVQKKLTADIPGLLIQNIGDTQNPVIAAQVAEQMMGMLTTAARQMSSNRLLRELGALKALKRGIIGGQLDEKIRKRLPNK